MHPFLLQTLWVGFLLFLQCHPSVWRGGLPQCCLLPVQRLQPSGSAASAVGISAQYSLAEHYLDALTPVAERLLLGSTRGLEQAQRLADHRVSHAIILCCGPEVS